MTTVGVAALILLAFVLGLSSFKGFPGERFGTTPPPEEVAAALKASNESEWKAARRLGVSREYVRDIRRLHMRPDGSVKPRPAPPPPPPLPPTS